MSHGALGTGSASQMRLFGVVSGIVVGDLLDLFELLDEVGLRNLHSRLVHSTVKQGYQRQCENAVKRMDAKHLVGPMVGRGKADEVGIFHVSESTFDLMLAAIAKDDFFVGQIGAIGEQNPLAENARDASNENGKCAAHQKCRNEQHHGRAEESQRQQKWLQAANARICRYVERTNAC